ncbi:MAG: LEA type 2 family protein [Deltaproteobacteria bacterium]|nr:LEA type 2 family protein [Deltaproteobacteria bacterium]
MPPHRAWLAVALLSCASGCAERLVRFKLARLTELTVFRMEREALSASVRCEVENPNPVGATLKELRFTTRMQGRVVGTGQVGQPLEVRGRRPFELRAPIRVRYVDLPSELPALVSTGSVPLEVEVHLVAETRLGRYPMRLTWQGRLPVARSVRVGVGGELADGAFRLRAVEVARVDLGGMELAVRLQATNPFPFPVGVRRVDYALFVGETFFGEGRSAGRLTLPARAGRELSLPLTATHMGALDGASALLRGASRLRVRGTVWIDPLAGVSAIPFDVTTELRAVLR